MGDAVEAAAVEDAKQLVAAVVVVQLVVAVVAEVGVPHLAAELKMAAQCASGADWGPR